MRLHDRYLFRELLSPLIFCLSGFMIFWVVFFFFGQAGAMRDAKLNFNESVELCAASLPEFFVLVLPVLLLLALLYALTQHARYNELTALRAAGVSLWRLCLPYFVVGLAVTAFYYALNELAVPRCQQYSQELLMRHVQNAGRTGPRQKNVFEKVGFNNRHAHRVWFIPEFNFKKKTLTNPDVRWTLPDGSERELKAESAVYTNAAWNFINAQTFSRADAGARWQQLPVTNQIAMTEFDETPRQFQLEAKFSDAEGLLSSRSADIPLSDLWPYLKMNPDLSGKDAGRILTKFHGRIAAPWMCFIVVLMAIPFGAQSGRRNLFFGVAGSIFIVFTYYILQQVSLAFGMSGHLPGWIAAWLPNIIFGTVGIILTLRTR
ncbi:MAG TPA: LptF/LptG family permease [Candidatus Sulfotelmatobacter sp.]|jgi:lipopolysaccharide export system permease protein|nr:LptF/LptG family permease [Candidatus Sulfotelmatobacter sp.]